MLCDTAQFRRQTFGDQPRFGREMPKFFHTGRGVVRCRAALQDIATQQHNAPHPVWTNLQFDCTSDWGHINDTASWHREYESLNCCERSQVSLIDEDVTATKHNGHAGNWHVNYQHSSSNFSTSCMRLLFPVYKLKSTETTSALFVVEWGIRVFYVGGRGRCRGDVVSGSRRHVIGCSTGSTWWRRRFTWLHEIIIIISCSSSSSIITLGIHQYHTSTFHTIARLLLRYNLAYVYQWFLSPRRANTDSGSCCRYKIYVAQVLLANTHLRSGKISPIFMGRNGNFGQRNSTRFSIVGLLFYNGKEYAKLKTLTLISDYQTIFTPNMRGRLNNNRETFMQTGVE